MPLRWTRGVACLSDSGRFPPLPSASGSRGSGTDLVCKRREVLARQSQPSGRWIMQSLASWMLCEQLSTASAGWDIYDKQLFCNVISNI